MQWMQGITCAYAAMGILAGQLLWLPGPPAECGITCQGMTAENSPHSRQRPRVHSGSVLMGLPDSAPAEAAVIDLLVCAAPGRDAGRVHGRDAGRVALRLAGRQRPLLCWGRVALPPRLPEPVCETLQIALLPHHPEAHTAQCDMPHQNGSLGPRMQHSCLAHLGLVQASCSQSL